MFFIYIWRWSRILQISVIVGKDFAELSDSKLNDLVFNMNKIFLSVSLHVINLNAVLERDEPWQCNSQDEKLIPDERHSSKIKNNALL